MPKIEKGALVQMSRRNVGGRGLILKRVKDINEYVGYDMTAAFHRLYDPSDPKFRFKEKRMNLWAERKTAQKRIYNHICKKNPDFEDSALIQFFWDYNFNYTYVLQARKLARKVKVDFCLVHWFKAPSDYSPGAYPRGFQNRSRWVYTKNIKTLKVEE
jgi:hypothetical protein